MVLTFFCCRFRFNYYLTLFQIASTKVKIFLEEMQYAVAFHTSQFNMELAFLVAQNLIDNDRNDYIDTDEGRLSFLLMETKSFIR